MRLWAGVGGCPGDGVEGRGRRAHLARQLFAPVDTRPREGLDPRHSPPMRGSPRDTWGPRRPAIVGVEGDGLPRTRSSGDRKSDSPRSPGASSSNPSLHPPPRRRKGEAGQSRAGAPSTDCWVSAGAAPRRERVSTDTLRVPSSAGSVPRPRRSASERSSSKKPPLPTPRPRPSPGPPSALHPPGLQGSETRRPDGSCAPTTPGNRPPVPPRPSALQSKQAGEDSLPDNGGSGRREGGGVRGDLEAGCSQGVKETVHLRGQGSGEHSPASSTPLRPPDRARSVPSPPLLPNT